MSDALSPLSVGLAGTALKEMEWRKFFYENISKFPEILYYITCNILTKDKPYELLQQFA